MVGRKTSLAGNVSLRDVIEGDLPIFFEHQREPEANRMAAFAARAQDAFLAHWNRILADPCVFVQTIVVDHQVAGNVVCWQSEGRQLVGYWIGKSWWDQGIASASLAALLKRVTTRPLYARVAKDNIPSIRVLEKCGFTLCAALTLTPPTPSEGVDELLFEIRR